MPGIKAYLTKGEKALLVSYVAHAGEEYNRYIEWCDQNFIAKERRFTPYYLKRWIQRRRVAVQNARQELREAARKASLHDKESRLKTLEAQAERLQERIENTKDDNIYLRLEEQLRKTLESIAKERGEFNNAGVEANDSFTITAIIEKSLRGQAEVVEAEYTQLAEKSTV